MSVGERLKHMDAQSAAANDCGTGAEQDLTLLIDKNSVFCYHILNTSDTDMREPL